MSVQIIAATRGQTLSFEICPNHDGQACACDPDQPSVHEVHSNLAEPPDLWPTAEEPWREKAKTEKQIQAARDTWAKQCAREALLLAQEKYAAEEPEDITTFVQDGKAAV